VDKFIKRTISTLILVTVIAFVVYGFPEWLFCGVVVLFILAGLAEFFNMAEAKNIFVFKKFGIIVGGLIPIAVFAANYTPALRDIWPLVIVFVCLFAFGLQFSRKGKDQDHLISMGLTLFAFLYIAWFFSFFIKIRALDNGRNLIAFVILIVKGTDIGAYLIGSKIGKNELIPRISPNKTKEGTIGGIVVGMVIALVFGKMLTDFSYVNILVIAFILSVCGQLGDLAESLMKRDCQVKDSGGIFAGIGGSLDLIDSLVIAAPIFYGYISLIQKL